MAFVIFRIETRRFVVTEYRRPRRRFFLAEKRVATVPEAVEKLDQTRIQAVLVESGAGDHANCSDDSVPRSWSWRLLRAQRLFGHPPISFSVRVVQRGRSGFAARRRHLDFLYPAVAQNPELMQKLAAKKATVLAIDLPPRQLSRAQKMDALTSMAGISGYRAVIEVANAFGRFFNGQMTAAGKVPPAKALLPEPGVAGFGCDWHGRPGAIVRAVHQRAEVVDQVKSLGGEFAHGRSR